jgi:hypothetical protein
MAIIEVHGQGGNALQLAVDSASVGDTIQVWGDPSLPYSGIDCGTKKLTITGMNGRDNCIIDGGHSYDEATDTHSGSRCIFCNDNYISTIENFTLCNGYSDADGAGLYYTNSTNCLIENCSGFNGAIYRGTHNNSIVRNNVVSNRGGGGYYTTMNNCEVYGNFSLKNGGGGDNTTFNNCRIYNNTTNGWGGGGIYSKLTDCEIYENTATSGGGTYNCILTNCIIHDNSSASYGGGCREGTATDCEIYDNIANDYGAATYQTPCVRCYIHGNINIKEDGVYICFSGSFDCCLIFNSVVGSVYSSTVVSDKRNCIYYGGGNVNIRNSVFYFVGESGSAMQGHKADRTNYENCLFYPAVSNLVDVEAKKILNGVDPLLDATYHLQKGSPCIGAGNAEYLQSATDLDGKEWKVPPSIGCYEFYGSKKFLPSSLHPLGV